MSFFIHYVIPFVVALVVLILFHELGHYLVARWCGVKVLRFSIGFGRPLLKRTGADGTEWVLAAIPLGGYVKMLGENQDEKVDEQDLRRAFHLQPVGRRFAIVAAGPIFNLLLAVVLYWGVFVGGSEMLRPLVEPTPVVEQPATPEAAAVPLNLARAGGLRAGDLVLGVNGDEVKSWQDLRWALLRHAIDRDEVRLSVRTLAGEEAVRTLDLRAFSLDEVGKEDLILRMGLRPFSPPARIDQIEENGAAAKGGLLVGDEIVAIDGKAVNSVREVVEAVRATPGQERLLTVRRGGEVLKLSVTPGERQREDGPPVGFIGVGFDFKQLFDTVQYGPVEALSRSLHLTWETCLLSLKSIVKMVLGEISLKNVSGPLTIADVAGKSARHGLDSFIWFLAFISISLGVLNLLPIPVLDGGHLLYYAIEFIKGSALPERVLEAGQKIGLVLLLMLMVFALYNDINRLFIS